MNRLITFAAFVTILIIAAAAIWLAETNMMPPSHTTTLSIPDDRIPH